MVIFRLSTDLGLSLIWGSNTPVYYLAACLVFKDAASYLDEWIRFHQRVGIEHFYLYDNDSSDDYATVIQPFLARGEVTLCQWPGAAPQNPAIQHCLDQHRGGYAGSLFSTTTNFFSPLLDLT